MLKSCIYSILLIALVGCSSLPDYHFDMGKSLLGYPDKEERQPGKFQSARKLPWESWNSEQDLQGNPLAEPAILRGDNYAQNGDYRRALTEYQSVKPAQLPSALAETLSLRIGSMYLALDQAQAALKVTSDYYKTRRLSVEQVDFAPSLFFGFAYGRIQNAEQSLAWFSRARLMAQADRARAPFVDSGLRMYLGSIPDDRLIGLETAWSSDSYINTQIAQERGRRLRSGGQSTTYAANRPFWSSPLDTPQANTPGALIVPDSSGPLVIGAVLPLTGKYAAFGQSMQHGIDLALDAYRSEPTGGEARAAVRDSGATADQARAATIELVASEHASIILGPLLSELNAPVSEIASQNQIPLISFSKSSSFQGSFNIFRLGPTVESQVRSLLDECERLGLKRYAIVYPTDDNGREFADSFRHRAALRSLQISSESPYTKGDSNALLAIAQQIEAAGEVEAVFLPDGIPAAAHFYSSLSSAARAKIKLLGTASWDNQGELANSRTALDGAIFVSPFFSASPKPVISQFVKAYQAKYGKTPDFLAAQGFDAATMALSALVRGRGQGNGFSQAIFEIERYDGLTGSIHAVQDGELERTFSVVQLNGESLVSPPAAAVPSFSVSGDSGIIRSGIPPIVDKGTANSNSGDFALQR